jgi:adenine-specific DNA methylase
MNANMTAVVPFSLKDAPSLIECVFPSMKVSSEAQKERKAVQGQMLTALGSYWKGRKPLVLTRACVLASLLPATDNPEIDLEVFESLMGMHDQSFEFRVKRKGDFPAVNSLPYSDRMTKVFRTEELKIDYMAPFWPMINAHLGTSASTIQELVEQLGVMRFGRRPRVADTFSGSGSIPFEAARTGCDVLASDLNPVACMLSWGAFNVIGADDDRRQTMQAEHDRVATKLEQQIIELGIEHDADGNRAKSFLYCLETHCPATGWLVPMLPTLVISRSKRVIASLIPDSSKKCYQIEVRTGVSKLELQDADEGTVRGGRLVHPMNSDPTGVAISTIRGDVADRKAERSNGLRMWSSADFVPAPNDIFQERLYCVQWVTKETFGRSRQTTYFAAPTDHDLHNEAKVERLVRENLTKWQQVGYLPDMAIEPGEKTDEPIRTRGWTHWHHLFNARQLLVGALTRQIAAERAEPSYYLEFARWLDNNSKLCRWTPSSINGEGEALNADRIGQVFYNQALNTMLTYGVRASTYQNRESYSSAALVGSSSIRNHRAADVTDVSDIYITDPPYADAVNYHEITEYFISWLRKDPPKEFAQWNWDSRRRLATKGKGEDFRASMVEAYKAMADHMPDNGIQIVMFTHQDGKVWSDMAQIFWGAGLQVMADWYIATETTSELKKGGYVQGTHIIVLRKRAGNDSGYSDEITQEVKEEVARQIEEMVGLNQSLRGHGRSENLFNDADLQMAGYAAALRVLTKYVKIDGKDMTVEAIRPRAKNERTIIDDIIEYAVQVANEHLVPEGMTEQTWRKLTGTERFYLKMLDMETTGSKKVDNYQNFAKAFRVADYGSLMTSVAANNAALKSAADFGKRQMGEDEFGSSLTRAILYGLWEMKNGVDDDAVLGHLRDLTSNYLDQRGDLQTIADYIAVKRSDIDATDAQNASILAGLIKNERLG